jgi:CBS domain-containing protein
MSPSSPPTGVDSPKTPTRHHRRRRNKSRQDLEDAQVEADLMVEVENTIRRKGSRRAVRGTHSSEELSELPLANAAAAGMAAAVAAAVAAGTASPPPHGVTSRRASADLIDSAAASPMASPRLGAKSPMRPTSQAPSSPHLRASPMKSKPKRLGSTEPVVSQTNLSGEGVPNDVVPLLTTARTAYAETTVGALCNQFALTSSPLAGRSIAAQALERFSSTNNYALPLWDNGVYAATLTAHDMIGHLMAVWRNDHAIYMDFGFASLAQVRRLCVPSTRPTKVDLQMSVSQAVERLDMFGLCVAVGESDGPVTLIVAQERLLQHFATQGATSLVETFGTWPLSSLPVFDSTEAPIVVADDTPTIDIFSLLLAHRTSAIGVVDDAGRLCGQLTIDAICTVNADTYERLVLPLRQYVGGTIEELRARGLDALAALIDPPTASASGSVADALACMRRADNHSGLCWLLDDHDRLRGLATARRMLQFLVFGKRGDRLIDVLRPDRVERRRVTAMASAASSSQLRKVGSRRSSGAQPILVRARDSFGDFGHRAINGDEDVVSGGGGGGGGGGMEDDAHDAEMMVDLVDHDGEVRAGALPSFAPAASSGDSSDSSDSSPGVDDDSDDDESLLTQVATEFVPGVVLLRLSLLELLRVEQPANGLPRVLSESLAELLRRNIGRNELSQPASISAMLPLLEFFGNSVAALRKSKRDTAPSAPVPLADSPLARTVSASVIYGFVKLYLRSLRSPLVPLSHHGYWYTTALSAPGRVRLFRLSALLVALPPANQLVLRSVVSAMQQLVLVGASTFATMAADLAGVCTRGALYSSRFGAAPSLQQLFCDLLINYETLALGMADVQRLHREEPSVAPHVANAAQVATQQGVLNKGSRSFGSVKWSVRYVRVIGSTLYFYANERAEQPLERLSLVGASVSPPEKSTAQFVVKLSGGKTMPLRPDNSNVTLAHQWVSELQKATKVKG